MEQMNENKFSSRERRENGGKGKKVKCSYHQLDIGNESKQLKHPILNLPICLAVFLYQYGKKFFFKYHFI